MDNSVYIALSKQTGQFRAMDVGANNIANAATTGYNSEAMLFTSYLVDDGNRHKMAFAQDIATYRNTNTGPIKATGNPLDVAIKGPGYFQVETPLGVRYTKAGNFQVDANNTLVTVEGHPVLDQTGQRITFEENDDQFVIGRIGNISTPQGEERGTIGVVKFANPQLLERVGGTLFRADGAALPDEEESEVAQGVLEGSNVQPVVELTGILKLSRSVAGTGELIKTIYDLERKTSNAWAETQG